MPASDVMERRFIFIVFAMGMAGCVGYLIWQRSRKPPGSTMQRESRDDLSSNIEDKVEPRSDFDAPVTAPDADDESALWRQEVSQTNQLAAAVVSKDPAEPRNDSSFDQEDEQIVDLQLHKRKRSLQPKAVYVPPYARATPPEKVPTDSDQPCPTSPATLEYIITIKIPLWLISKFIGKQGCGIKSLSRLSGAEFKIPRRSAANCSHTSCSIIGSAKQIEAALALISQRYPEVTLPHMPSMKLFHGSKHKPPRAELQASACTSIPPVELPSKQFYVSVSHVDSISMSTIWLRVVDQSVDRSPWQQLYEKINSTYSFASNCEQYVGEQDKGLVEVGQFCAVRIGDGNFERGCVKELLDTDNDVYKVLLLDRGGHVSANSSSIISLRINHMRLPAQAMQVNLLGPSPGFEVGRVLEACVNKDAVPPIVELHWNEGEEQVSVSAELVAT